MNWQTVLTIYCIWMMGISAISLILSIKNTKKHFEQGEQLIQNPIKGKQEELQTRIEEIIEDIENQRRGYRDE